MKTLLLNTGLLLLILCSCSGKKSFMHQRYTSLHHKNHSTEAAAPQSRGSVAYKPARAEAVNLASQQVNVIPAVETVAPAAIALEATGTSNSRSPVLTANAGAAKIANASSPKELNSGFVKSASKAYKQMTKKSEKRGLLFGVIDALLSIILIVVVVAVVVFLIVILI